MSSHFCLTLTVFIPVSSDYCITFSGALSLSLSRCLSASASLAFQLSSQSEKVFYLGFRRVGASYLLKNCRSVVSNLRECSQRCGLNARRKNHFISLWPLIRAKRSTPIQDLFYFFEPTRLAGRISVSSKIINCSKKNRFVFAREAKKRVAKSMN